jgi:hypothetical protein
LRSRHGVPDSVSLQAAAFLFFLQLCFFGHGLQLQFSLGAYARTFSKPHTSKKALEPGKPEASFFFSGSGPVAGYVFFYVLTAALDLVVGCYGIGVFILSSQDTLAGHAAPEKNGV